MTNPITEVLAVLSMVELDRLCVLRASKKHSTKKLRVNELARAYGDRFGELLDDLTRSVLADLLRSQQFELRGTLLEFDNVSSLSKRQMQVAIYHVFANRWRPTSVTEGPIDALRMRVIDWGDGDDVDDSIDSAVQFDARISAPTWPVFESLSAHRAQSLSGARQPLQDFQQEAVDRLVAMFVLRRAPQAARGILVLPTGGGKTRTSLQFLIDTYVTKGQKVLWVTHRRDLIDQVHGELRSLAWLANSVSSFSVSRLHQGARDLSGDIVLASASTLARQQLTRGAFERYGKRLGIVCFDEAHHAVADSTWTALEKIVGTEVPLLSLTATPYRMEAGGQAKLDRALGPVVYTKSFAELVSRGFLARPIFVQQALESTKTLQLSDVLDRKLMTRDDLSDEVIRAVARTPGRNEEIVRHWSKSSALFGKTIAFACDIDHAESLARRFLEKGFPTGVVHSQLDRDSRVQMIEAFRRAKGPSILVNVGLLTEGTNIPDTQTVLVARPTASTSLFHQMIGRGSRGEKVVPGKKVFHVIDCVDGLAAHGVLLAGQRVAVEFEIPIDSRIARAESQELTRDRVAVPTIPPPVLEDPAAVRALMRGVTLAAAWLALSRRLPETIVLTAAISFEYDGGKRIVPVFVETAPAVELALELLATVLRGGRWSDIESKATSLDEQGAVNRREWHKAIAYARQQGRAPTILHDDFVRRDFTAERSIALVVAEHARRIASMRDSAAHQAAAGWFDATPALRTLYDSSEQYVEDLNSLSGRIRDSDLVMEQAPVKAPVSDAVASDSVQQQQAANTARSATLVEEHSALVLVPTRQPTVIDAFLRVCAAVGLADNELSEGERSVIAKAVEHVLRIDGFLADDAAIDRVVSNISIKRACDELCEHLQWDQRSALLDWLIRTALADDRLHVREIVAIQEIASDLGIPSDDCARRLGWHDNDSPAKARVILGSTIVCPVCSSAMSMPAHFCGECGISLVPSSEPASGARTSVAEVVDQPPTCGKCGAKSFMPARFCGECGAPFGDSSQSTLGATPASSVESSSDRTPQNSGNQADSNNGVSEERRPTDDSMPDFSTGRLAEDWLFERLCSEFDRSTIERRDRDGAGESDFRITVTDPHAAARRELHIEVKHSSSSDNASIYWSFLEIEKARQVAVNGGEYYLVILTPSTSGALGGYDAFWSLDPRADFLGCERQVRWEWRSEYFPVADFQYWRHTPPRVFDDEPQSGHYRIKVALRSLATLHACPDGADVIAPVRVWHEQYRHPPHED